MREPTFDILLCAVMSVVLQLAMHCGYYHTSSRYVVFCWEARTTDMYHCDDGNVTMSKACKAGLQVEQQTLAFWFPLVHVKKGFNFLLELACVFTFD